MLPDNWIMLPNEGSGGSIGSEFDGMLFLFLLTIKLGFPKKNIGEARIF